jgi:hypothetical protein
MKHLLMGVAMLACLASQTVKAGQSCEEKAPTPTQVRESLELAEQAREALENSQAEVAVIARAGQNLDKWGLHYSHLAFVWRDDPHGRYSVVHLLNRCGTAEGALFDQGLGDFFMDDMYQFRTLIMIPDAQLQERLAGMLESGRAGRFLEPHYNMLAYPYSTQFENSNQWPLEVLAAAMSSELQINDRESAQFWLRNVGYQPSVIHLSAFERLGAETTRVNISFNDHPFNRRMAGQIDTVTVDSIQRFLQVKDPGLKEIVLTR